MLRAFLFYGDPMEAQKDRGIYDGVDFPWEKNYSGLGCRRLCFRGAAWTRSKAPHRNYPNPLFSLLLTADDPAVRRLAARLLDKEQAPDLIIDGEMQLATALNSSIRLKHFPFSTLEKDANVLIFPALHSGNLALQLMEYVGGAVPIGPILMGTRLPVHLLQYGATAEEVVNLVTVGIVEAAALRQAA